jgi:hypothetical protein
MSLLVAAEDDDLVLFGNDGDKEAHHLKEAIVVGFGEGLI